MTTPARGPVALLLVDLQEDYFAREMWPGRDAVLGGAAALLREFREAGAPVAHIHTIVAPDGSDAMPHWLPDKLLCVAGTPGVLPPVELMPEPDEFVAVKQHYDGFADPALEPWLRSRGVETVVVAGLYTQTCVRAAVLGAYQRGFRVVMALDALGTDSREFERMNLEWLGARAATLLDNNGVRALVASATPSGSSTNIDSVVSRAVTSQEMWARESLDTRRDVLARWAAAVAAKREDFAEAISRNVAKPLAMARDEVSRAIEHIHATLALTDAEVTGSREIAAGVSVRQVPLGVVAAILPWNNPVALTVGKIAPALVSGNGVVVKPAPQGDRVTGLLVDEIISAGCPRDLVSVVSGGAETAALLAGTLGISGVTVTGSIQTGRALARICTDRGIPLQAELGGNNAAIVAGAVDIGDVAAQLTLNAFAYAGQRCTALRRFVVLEKDVDAFVEALRSAVDSLVLGDPLRDDVLAGPVISAQAATRIRYAVAEAERTGCEVVTRWSPPGSDGWFAAHSEAFVAPCVLLVRDADHPLVQTETFGPVAVIQPARDLAHAVALANGVSQGLLTAVCSDNPTVIEAVRAQAATGIIQAFASPVPVHAEAPFGGWKASGFGPPEHGVWDMAFYTRPQTSYS